MKIIMKAKKSLGQNFLTSKSIVKMIVDTGSIDFQNTVLEVGPGKGILTAELVKYAGKVIAVEKDNALSSLLRDRFKQEIQDGKLEIINDDILNLDLKDYGLKNRNYKVIANIPYNITGAIIKRFLSCDIQPSKMVLLVQKEVAERVARSKKESLFSISVKAYGEPKYVKTVKAGNFNPKPKVDSAILAINNISKNFFADISEENFFNIVKIGFAHKRKLLASNLRSNFPRISLGKLGEIFDQIGISRKTRAEDISINQWKNLVREI
jgi:16S rRNA (adenine1518-N6/adenine1519-N6)-dimethyltransferase